MSHDLIPVGQWNAEMAFDTWESESREHNMDKKLLCDLKTVIYVVWLCSNIMEPHRNKLMQLSDTNGLMCCYYLYETNSKALYSRSWADVGFAGKSFIREALYLTPQECGLCWDTTEHRSQLLSPHRSAKNLIFHLLCFKYEEYRAVSRSSSLLPKQRSRVLIPSDVSLTWSCVLQTRGYHRSRILDSTHNRPLENLPKLDMHKIIFKIEHLIQNVIDQNRLLGIRQL